MIYMPIILVILFPISLFSQEQIRNYNLGLDSLRLEKTSHYILNNKLEFNLPLYSLSKIIDPSESHFEEEFLNYNSKSLAQLYSMVMNRIKNDIYQSFAVYRKWQNNYYLGVVSDVLGSVGTAVAATHTIYKYRKKYGLK